ncbi:hypothetical protein V8G54_006586 [Vigna mungo]|uniref:Uncharacterized protein n=1 Tax=Vigna mungo TaxID=3915 RepID=A0AAQ3S876_VIGMU
MEAHKEKREEMEKEEEMKRGSKNSNKEEKGSKGETVSKRMIGESIISDAGDKQRAQTPYDVLVFSPGFLPSLMVDDLGARLSLGFRSSYAYLSNNVVDQVIINNVLLNSQIVERCITREASRASTTKGERRTQCHFRQSS